jgi:hypothetical protein
VTNTGWMEHEAHAGDPIDSWRIRRLRQQPRRTRGEDVVGRLLRPHEAPSLLDRLGTLEDAVVEVGIRLDELELELQESRDPSASSGAGKPGEPQPAPGQSSEIEPAHGYTLFVPSPTGYEIVEMAGAAPQPGASVTLGADRYTVDGRRRTPLPLDGRPCLVLTLTPPPE